VRLDELKPAPGSVKQRKRVGRGIGSGHGKTSTRGHKGAKARRSIRPGFEGGQTPLHRRLPRKRGFTNIFKKEYAIINLDMLAKQPEDTITPEVLLEKGIIRDVKSGLRVLGRGELEKAITVRAHYFSKSAEEKIKAKGGVVERIGPPQAVEPVAPKKKKPAAEPESPKSPVVEPEAPVGPAAEVPAAPEAPAVEPEAPKKKPATPKKPAAPKKKPAAPKKTAAKAKTESEPKKKSKPKAGDAEVTE